MLLNDFGNKLLNDSYLIPFHLCVFVYFFLIVIKATLLIQRWYRRYLARMEIKRRTTWTIFTNIEYSAEHDQVRLFNFFNDLLVHMPAAKNIKDLDNISSSSTGK